MGTNQKKTPEGEPIPAGTRAESSLPPVLLPGIHDAVLGSYLVDASLEATSRLSDTCSSANTNTDTIFAMVLHDFQRNGTPHFGPRCGPVVRPFEHEGCLAT